VTNSNAASVIVPNLIFEELEMQRTREITQRPPAVRSPLDQASLPCSARPSVTTL
jgi:hypothetical protein